MAGEIRAEIVGSLLRPERLHHARTDLERGHIGVAEFKHAEDTAVDEAVRIQEEAGIDVVTDGELRRPLGFFGNFVESLGGIAPKGGRTVIFRDEAGEELPLSLPVVTGKLSRRHSMVAEEWVYLRAKTTKPTKVTLISPVLAGNYWQPEVSSHAYATREAYLADVVDLLRWEVDELIRLGCSYIQLDSPAYSSLLDPERREQMRAQGVDPDRRIDQAIEAENAIIDGHPGITFAIHICRGNHRGHFSSRGSFEPIKRVFEQTLFNRFLLEYADAERTGGFDVLRAIPEDRTVVLGLISTTTGRLESKEEVIQRIEGAAKFVPVERLALSPQCGFAASAEGNRLTVEEQRQKLELVAAVARAVWGGAAA